ncbi:MAG: hypothetical protein GF414_00545 [Candidatus Altiarchaeales archaeon]|nr:hypothetical protein [Candidatus Altiarchaeales archaeon]
MEGFMREIDEIVKRNRWYGASLALGVPSSEEDSISTQKELQDKLDATLKWAVKEFDEWKSNLVNYFPEEEEVEEPTSFAFEDLPEVLGDYKEGSMGHLIVTYRLSEGITDTKEIEYWRETPLYQGRLHEWLLDIFRYGDEHIGEVHNSILRMRELRGLFQILTDDDHTLKHIEQWCFFDVV